MKNESYISIDSPLDPQLKKIKLKEIEALKDKVIG